MDDRHEYPLTIQINGRTLARVVIDQHYAEKHSESVSDELILELILELIKSIDGEDFLVESEREGFEYFTAEPVYHNDEPYRVIMLLYMHDDFLGVVNVFRVDRR